MKRTVSQAWPAIEKDMGEESDGESTIDEDADLLEELLERVQKLHVMLADILEGLSRINSKLN